MDLLLRAFTFGVSIVLSSAAVAQTNSWTGNGSGNWHDLSWSGGVRPSISDSAAVVTNAGSKAVAVNAVTANSFPGSMIISNLLVSGTPNSTNTVMLNFVGTQVPFRVQTSANIRSNGVLLNLNSLFQLQGESPTLLLDGGSVRQEGGSNILAGVCHVGVAERGRYTLSNGTTVSSDVRIGGSAGGTFDHLAGLHVTRFLSVSGPGMTPGFYNLSTGTVRAENVEVGLGGLGYFSHIDGAVFITNTLSLGQSGSGYYSILNGLLETAVTELGTGRFGIGSVNQYGGTHQTTNLILRSNVGFPFANSDYWQTGGLLLAKNVRIEDGCRYHQDGGTNITAGELLGSYSLSAGRLLSSATVVSGYQASASFLQSGGAHVNTNQIRIGGSSSSCSYHLSGGMLHAPDLYINFGGAFVFTGGELLDNNAVTLAQGLISRTGGTGTFGALSLRPGVSTLHFGSEPTIQQFAASSAVLWQGNLEIGGWQGSTNGGGVHRLFFGSSSSGLNADQLSRITFHSPAGFPPGMYFARILPTGELVPQVQPILRFQASVTNLALDWHHSLILQTSTNVQGPYFDLNVSSPFPVEFNEPKRFFRAKYGNATQTFGLVQTNGSTLTLDGVVSVTFPAGSFEESQFVELACTAREMTDQEFWLTTSMFSADSRLPFELRIQVATAPSLPYTTTFIIPDSFLTDLPSNAELQVFAQMFQNGGDEVIDTFELFPSTYNASNKTVTVTLPPETFTDRRTSFSGFEAILVIGTTPTKPQSSPRQSILQAGNTESVLPNPSDAFASPREAFASVFGLAASGCEGSSLSSPLAGTPIITSQFNGTKHFGVDYQAPNGTQVFSMADGVVERVGFDQRPLPAPDPRSGKMVKGWGHYIIVRHTDGSKSLYAHLATNSVAVTIGSAVNKGATLALSNNSGGSSGPHLHVEYAPNGKIYNRASKVNPVPCIDKNVTGSVTVGDGGADADDAFSVSINGIQVCRTTIGATNTCGIGNLRPGTATLTLEVDVAPDNLGTYYIALSQGLTFFDGSTVRSGTLPQGGSASFVIQIPDPAP